MADAAAAPVSEAPEESKTQAYVPPGQREPTETVDDEDVFDEDEDQGPLVTHPLKNSWSLVFEDPSQLKPNPTEAEYQANMRKLYDIKTIESFWQVLNNVQDIAQMQGCNFSMFRDGIKPAREDPANANGGRFVIFVPLDEEVTIDADRSTADSKYPLSVAWMQVMLHMIGNQFGGNFVTGAIVSNLAGKGWPAHRIQLWVSETDRLKVQRARDVLYSFCSQYDVDFLPHCVNSKQHFIHLNSVNELLRQPNLDCLLIGDVLFEKLFPSTQSSRGVGKRLPRSCAVTAGINPVEGVRWRYNCRLASKPELCQSRVILSAGTYDCTNKRIDHDAAAAEFIEMIQDMVKAGFKTIDVVNVPAFPHAAYPCGNFNTKVQAAVEGLPGVNIIDIHTITTDRPDFLDRNCLSVKGLELLYKRLNLPQDKPRGQKSRRGSGSGGRDGRGRDGRSGGGRDGRGRGRSSGGWSR
eukprot:m.355418 g.355418  ORF g.355418 m.355418 type:complete len:466 (-) comp17249_c0_seq1:229-1626(-)